MHASKPPGESHGQESPALPEAPTPLPSSPPVRDWLLLRQRNHPMQLTVAPGPSPGTQNITYTLKFVILIMPNYSFKSMVESP